METIRKYKGHSSNDEPRPGKGRPAGKNRIPLSLEQRRARNAQYEKERRCETAEAMAQLAEAVGCESTMTNGDLLAKVISRLQNAAERNTAKEIAQLRRCNEKLISQIATLEERLDNLGQLDNELKTKKRKAYDFDENGNSAKRIKQKSYTEVPPEIETPSPASHDSDTAVVRLPVAKSDSEIERWTIEDLIAKYL